MRGCWDGCFYGKVPRRSEVPTESESGNAATGGAGWRAAGACEVERSLPRTRQPSWCSSVPEVVSTFRLSDAPAQRERSQLTRRRRAKAKGLRSSGLPTGRVGVNVNSRGRLMRRNQLSPGQIRTSKIVHSKVICGYSGTHGTTPALNPRSLPIKRPTLWLQREPRELWGFLVVIRTVHALRAPLSVLVFSSSPPPRVKHWN
jgi:hypothetical protein